MLNATLGDSILGKRLGRIGDTENIFRYSVALGEVCIGDRFTGFDAFLLLSRNRWSR